MTPRFRRVCTMGGAAALILALGYAGLASEAPAAGSAAQPPPPVISTHADSLALLTARRVVKALGQDLMSTLMTTLERGGPAHAIFFCADSAQVRTARYQRDGLYVRRVSTRYRNPANAPDSLEAAALKLLAERHAAKDLPSDLTEVRKAADGTRTLHYIVPIVLSPPCLACHGPADDLAPDVRETILLRYPKDAATGFRAGDLRGAFSVRLRMPDAR